MCIEGQFRPRSLKKMDKAKFLADDQYCQLSASDISCAGGNKTLALRRLLDDEMATAFIAVLDTDGATVWTAQADENGDQVRGEDGLAEIEWQSLEDFE